MIYLRQNEDGSLSFVSSTDDSVVMTLGADGNVTIPDTTFSFVNLDLGASGTAGSLDVFPSTAAKGKLSLVAANNTGDTTTTITNAEQAAARTYTIPDAGASASFVMTAGAQTIGGAKTFSSNIIPTGGVAAAGGFATSPRCWHTGSAPAQVSTDGTDTTPANTETYIAEVFVPANATLTGVAIMNGSAVSGNIKVGLANSSGAVVAESASTGQSGTDAYQRVPFSSTYNAVGPATYYVLLQVDNNTARFNSHTFGNFGASKKTGETYGTFTTITPPTTFTASQGPIASLY
jgi:hypothetical protein